MMYERQLTVMREEHAKASPMSKPVRSFHVVGSAVQFFDASGCTLLEPCERCALTHGGSRNSSFVRQELEAQRVRVMSLFGGSASVTAITSAIASEQVFDAVFQLLSVLHSRVLSDPLCIGLYLYFRSFFVLCCCYGYLVYFKMLPTTRVPNGRIPLGLLCCL